MTTNSQLLTTEPKTNKQMKNMQASRTGTESQKWRSHGGLSVGERGRKGTENKHKWQVENRQGRLRIVQEMQKPKNLYVRPMDMN